MLGHLSQEEFHRGAPRRKCGALCSGSCAASRVFRATFQWRHVKRQVEQAEQISGRGALDASLVRSRCWASPS
eukprot:5646014-Pyramimonas_sp.AAC.1